MSRFWVLLLLFTIAGLGYNSLEQNFTCPICGTHWTQRIETSARPSGLRLDLRQLGDVVDPPTLPQCPQCRFVIFSETLKPATLEKLKSFVQGQDYQMFAAKGPTYSSLAQIQQYLKAPPRFIAQSYLRAAWQVEDRPVLATRFFISAEQQLARALNGMIPTEKDYPTSALLRAEVLRRLERWDDAAAQIRALADRADFQDAKRKAIVEQELDLIARRDSQPQQLREPGESSTPTEMLPDPEVLSIRKPKSE
jgi:hypothetical protein